MWCNLDMESFDIGIQNDVFLCDMMGEGWGMWMRQTRETAEHNGVNYTIVQIDQWRDRGESWDFEFCECVCVLIFSGRRGRKTKKNTNKNEIEC